MYIAIEGIDTAGKSTQIARLAEVYPDAIITKEPGATKIGEKIRDIVLSGEVQSAKAEFCSFWQTVQSICKRWSVPTSTNSLSLTAV